MVEGDVLWYLRGDLSRVNRILLERPLSIGEEALINPCTGVIIIHLR